MSYSDLLAGEQFSHPSKAVSLDEFMVNVQVGDYVRSSATRILKVTGKQWQLKNGNYEVVYYGEYVKSPGADIRGPDERADTFHMQLEGASWSPTILHGRRSQWIDGKWYIGIGAIRRITPLGPGSKGDFVSMTFHDFLPPGRYAIVPDGPVSVTYAKYTENYAITYTANSGWVHLTFGPSSRVVGEFEAAFSEINTTITSGRFDVDAPKPGALSGGPKHEAQDLQLLMRLGL
jgi:hypothetical protein